MLSPAQTPQSNAPKIRLFVDFWNYELSMKQADPNFRTDWKKIGPHLASVAAQMAGVSAPINYQGMNVYGSYNTKTGSDQGLKRWATTILDTFPGVHVTFIERQKKKSPPSCPACHEAVQLCPSCGADMRGTEEKGVDTRIVTDMMSLAWAANYDVAILVSSDKDFVPVAEFLQIRGIKVIHGAFPPRGAVLTQKCWASIDIQKERQNFQR